jgi:hypothetical protein
MDIEQKIKDLLKKWFQLFETLKTRRLKKPTKETILRIKKREHFRRIGLSLLKEKNE